MSQRWLFFVEGAAILTCTFHSCNIMYVLMVVEVLQQSVRVRRSNLLCDIIVLRIAVMLHQLVEACQERHNITKYTYKSLANMDKHGRVVHQQLLQVFFHQQLQPMLGISLCLPHPSLVPQVPAVYVQPDGEAEN